MRKEFKPIKKNSISDEIIDQIISLIREGKLKEGERLPSEREMIDLFKVGRSSVREALKSLATTGIIQRTNKGTVVTKAEEENYSTFLLKGNLTSIEEVFEARKAIEIEMVGLAAKRATSNEVKEMHQLISGTMDANILLTSDISFHRALAKASHNELLIRIYNMVTGLLFQTHKYYFLIESGSSRMPAKTIETFIKTVNDYHKKILKAVEHNEVKAAKKFMGDHLDYAEKGLIRESGKRNLGN